MPKIAWVTGAAGFLGKHVAQAYSEAGWEVHGLGYSSWIEETPETWGLTSWTNTQITTDALNRLVLNNTPDVVIHCAGGSSVALSNSDPANDFQRTVESVATLLEFIRIKIPEAKVIYPSSAAVYGSAGSDALTEKTVLAPCSPYGVHKRMSEQLLDSYSQFFSLDTVAVRFFSLYGAGLQKQLLWDANNKLYNNSFSFGGTGQETRDFLHVTDAAKLLLHLADIPKMDRCLVLNGGRGVASTIADLLHCLAKANGFNMQPVFNGIVRSGDPQHLVSNSNPAQALGWSPSVTLEDGLREYANWYRSLKSQH